MVVGPIVGSDYYGYGRRSSVSAQQGTYATRYDILFHAAPASYLQLIALLCLLLLYHNIQLLYWVHHITAFHSFYLRVLSRLPWKLVGGSFHGSRLLPRIN